MDGGAHGEQYVITCVAKCVQRKMSCTHSRCICTPNALLQGEYFEMIGKK